MLSLSTESENEDSTDEPQCASAGRAGVWMPIIGEDEGPNVLPFTGQPGPIQAPPDNARPIDYVKLFFDDCLVAKIVEETNRYADQWIAAHQVYLRNHPRSLVHIWIKQGKTTKEEMYAFLSVVINMGLNQKPVQHSYWTTCYKSQITPWFGDHLSRDRYFLILKFLHFNNNENLPPIDHPNFKLFKVEPIITDLANKFSKFYKPHMNISIDESMVGYKGKTPHLRQYMPNKHNARFGLKLWCLCDSSTSYTSVFEVFKGAADIGDRQAEGLTYTLVMRLMEKAGLFNKGYHLGLDNYFTSPALLYDLYSAHVTATGTVRKSRKGLPKSVTAAKLANKSVVERRRGNLLCVGYKDGSKQPILLSTKAKSGYCTATNSKGKEKMVPKVIKLYNESMGGVDMSNARLYAYLCKRRTMKWTHKLFFALLGRSVLNAYIIYCENKPTFKCSSRYLFTVLAVEGMMANHKPPHMGIRKRRSKAEINVARGLNGQEITAPATDIQTVNTNCKLQKLAVGKKRNCVNKHNRRTRSAYMCPACDVGLCPQCFVDYHRDRELL